MNSYIHLKNLTPNNLKLITLFKVMLFILIASLNMRIPWRVR
nr:MAG TPA: hypothetical protein [Caudoviricetes sp.]